MEDTNSGDPLPLYDAPTGVTGNTLDFDPHPNFTATSSGGGAPDTTDGNLRFVVEANPSEIIPVLLITEAGTTTLSGTGTDATFGNATFFGFVEIEEVDGVAINPITIPLSMTYAPQATFFLGTDGAGAHPWTGSAFIDLTQVLNDEGISFTDGVTQASVNIDNILVAGSQTDSTATVTKSDFKVTVPEPSTTMLAFVAFASLLATGRRRIT